MKKIARALPIIVAITMLMAFNSPKTAKKENINFFKGTFKEALGASKQQNKPIFIDSYTASCRWCKKMDKTTFRNRNVVHYLNTHFINVKMDMYGKEGKTMKRKYDIDALPTLLFVNSKGKSLVRVNGFIDASDFMRKAKKAKRRYK